MRATQPRVSTDRRTRPGRKALRLSIFSSVKASGGVAFTVMAAACAAGGFLGFQGKLTGDWVLALGLVVFFSAIAWFYYSEFERFRYLRVLFEEVLNSEKNYEVLLTETRRERDDFSAELIKHRAEIEVVRAMQLTIRSAQQPREER